MILALVVVAVSSAFPAFKILGELKLFVVQSGSMEPAIKTGSVVLIQKKDTYSIGEIITFLNSGGKSETTTHRVVQSKLENGQEVFTTKGDANTGKDRERAKAQNILGKVVYTIPYLGYVVSFTRTQLGLTLLIIIPATIIVYGELINLKKEIMELIIKRKESRLSLQEK